MLSEGEISFELPEEQILEIAKRLIADKKTPEQAGLCGDVRARVEKAINRIIRETAQEKISDI
jgi:hypothetical protein